MESNNQISMQSLNDDALEYVIGGKLSKGQKGTLIAGSILALTGTVLAPLSILLSNDVDNCTSTTLCTIGIVSTAISASLLTGAITSISCGQNSLEEK